MAVGVAARWILVVPGDRVLVTPAGPDAHHFSTRPPGQSPAGRVFVLQSPTPPPHPHTGCHIPRGNVFALPRVTPRYPKTYTLTCGLTIYEAKLKTISRYP